MREGASENAREREIRQYDLQCQLQHQEMERERWRRGGDYEQKGHGGVKLQDYDNLIGVAY